MAATVVVGSCSQSPEVAATLPATSAAAGNVSDSDVTNRVKTALLLNESLKGFKISVVTLKGDVRLIGTLDGQSQITTKRSRLRAPQTALTRFTMSLRSKSKQLMSMPWLSALLDLD